MTDLISRADAIAYIDRVIKSGLGRHKSLDYIRKYISALPSADAEPKRVLQGYCKGANTIQTIRHEELTQIANTRKAVESSDAVQGWIPCSEKLPKRDELVLVTYKTTDRIHLCKYIDDGSENPWWSYIDDCCAWNNVVLAWMPLPKPYRAESEVEE